MFTFSQAPISAALSSTWAACSALVTDGLAHRLGVAHFSLPDIETLLQEPTRPAVCMLELHPLLPQRKLVGVCLRKVRWGCRDGG